MRRQYRFAQTEGDIVNLLIKLAIKGGLPDPQCSRSPTDMRIIAPKHNSYCFLLYLLQCFRLSVHTVAGYLSKLRFWHNLFMRTAIGNRDNQRNENCTRNMGTISLLPERIMGMPSEGGQQILNDMA